MTSRPFLDYLLHPEVSAVIVNELGYASANQAAMDFVDPALRSDSVLFPTPDQIAKAEWFLPLSPEALELRNTLFERLEMPGR